MFLVLFQSLCALSSGQTVTENVITGRPSVESAEMLSDGSYVVSSVNTQGAGGIFKYNSSGMMDSTFDVSIAQGMWTAGLAVSADSSTVYAAHMGRKVTKYQLSSTALVNMSNYDPGFNPNGLCLSEDGAHLFVAAHGWQIHPQQGPMPDPTSDGGGFAIITLATGSVNTVFTNMSTTRALNGCTVSNGIVYFATFQMGVASYNIATSTYTETLPWSESLKSAQNGSIKLAGDGIAYYDGMFYVSIWTMQITSPGPPPQIAEGPTSAIYQCDPSSTCTSFVTMAAADISIHSNKIIAPRILLAKVSTVDLPTTTMTTVPTTTGSSDSQTSEGKVKLPSAVIFATTSAMLIQVLSL